MHIIIKILLYGEIFAFLSAAFLLTSQKNSWSLLSILRFLVSLSRGIQSQQSIQAERIQTFNPDFIPDYKSIQTNHVVKMHSILSSYYCEYFMLLSANLISQLFFKRMFCYFYFFVRMRWTRHLSQIWWKLTVFFGISATKSVIWETFKASK